MSAHNDLIKDQFTRQAEPFSRVKWHNHDELLHLMLGMANIKTTDTVLDVACGPGIVACEAAKSAAFVTGIDLTPAMIELARKRQKDEALQNMEWRTGDVYSLSFKESSFSKVLTRFSFHHFLEPAAVLREMWRSAASGATVVVTDVYASEYPDRAQAYDRMEKLRDPSHVRALPLSELLEMYHAIGAEDVRVEFFRLEVELEKQLAASFPNAGDDEKIRELFHRDLAENRMGVNPHMKDGQIYFSYPIAVIAGTKA